LELVRREYAPGRFFGSKSGVLSPHDANNATVVAAYAGHLRIGRPGALANYWHGCGRAACRLGRKPKL